MQAIAMSELLKTNKDLRCHKAYIIIMRLLFFDPKLHLAYRLLSYYRI